MFKFRDDEEDERKTMRYSDSALTGKKTKSFLWEIEIFNRVWKQCMSALSLLSLPPRLLSRPFSDDDEEGEGGDDDGEGHIDDNDDEGEPIPSSTTTTTRGRNRSLEL
ncbi:hypothetical protein L3X38_042623 [Prunus dulcis]|uniref:Uncharacterized protein n=1 Tax=Prunus dulcis TaxID=3755 RepID=A0AAD4YKH2_PRUDU|nr:hypothetical protein L3X38_042623 [Prunus dulcis]